MKGTRFRIRPLTPFGTPLAGDTLFGHLCWALALRLGRDALERLLEGYTEGRPYAVVSDAFPAGLLPRPAMPEAESGLAADPARRKALRRLRWLPADAPRPTLAAWLAGAVAGPAVAETVRTQNTIHRWTGTTGSGPFAPRQSAQTEFAPGTLLDLHMLHDPGRLDAALLRQALDDIGRGGYGRDASTGLGKFEIADVADRPEPPPTRRAMTLAPCAPSPAGLDTDACRWLPMTHFGRHGGTAALGGGGGPFKRPVLLARTGAVLVWREAAPRAFHGSGLGGARNPLSAVIPGTVMQGYAPLVPLPEEGLSR
jgi:CRISPR-associated protein Csm4